MAERQGTTDNGQVLAGPLRKRLSPEERKVIAGASIGTVFEWYDFLLYGSLAPVIAKQFFSKADPTTGMIFALLAFAAGFIIRPFGALLFGRLGDLVGRKYTFLVTIVLMGAATFGVGLLPNYDAIGVAAPIILIGLRLLQGLAVGGEYGGAAVYVAEHAPHGQRGAFTAWVQTTGSLGFLLSLLMILGSRTLVGEASFAEWGWRIPFLASVLLLAISVWIRLSMEESPVFARMKAQGRTSRAPLTEAFGNWSNVRLVLAALFGLITGFSVIWYTSQFYALMFLTQILKVEGSTANMLVGAAVLLATPLYIVFGKLSDRVGRKPVILAGLLLAVVTLVPIFKALTHFANPALEAALAQAPVVVIADPADCHFQFNPTGTRKFTSSCDIAKSKLVAASVNYTNQAAATGSSAMVKVGDRLITSFDAGGMAKAEVESRTSAFARELNAAIQAAGYPAKADPAQVNKPMVMLLVFSLIVFATMAYGPAAAILVEMFPARIRYSSLSLPYHVGAGWFGGLMPTVAFAMVVFQGDIYFGLWYPIVIASTAVVVGALLLPETKNVNIVEDH